MTSDDDAHRISRLPVRGRPSAPRLRVPRGKLEMVVTYLELRRPAARAPAPHRGEKLSLLRAEACSVSFYRYLYETIGEAWMWYARRLLDDDALAEIIQDPKVEIYVLYVAGVPAGYVELDLRVDDAVEIAYFGLMPEFIGRGLGHYLLDWSVDEAWRKRPQRVWVHTCNFDHPTAIAVYQRSGFVPYEQEHLIIDDPRKRGNLPKGREFKT